MIIPEPARKQLWNRQEEEARDSIDREKSPNPQWIQDYHRGRYHGIRECIDILGIDINKPTFMARLYMKVLRPSIPLIIFILGVLCGKVIL